MLVLSVAGMDLARQTERMVIALVLAGAAIEVLGGPDPNAPPTFNPPPIDRAIWEATSDNVPTSQIDRIVYAELEKLGVRPAICSDAVFIRRLYLDTMGVLPSPAEVTAFLSDTNPAKRAQLIDQVLNRPEFADYWAMKWGDILRIKAEFPVNLWPNAAQAFHRWVWESIRFNKPYTQFVREMLTTNGSNFRVGPVNFYRAVQNRTPEGWATAVALTFMGTRLDTWPSNKVAGMAAFFSQLSIKPTKEWKEEIVFWDPERIVVRTTNAAAVTVPRVAEFPDGTKVELRDDRDPREVFADWLITPSNAWFTANIANRIWAWLLGRGIVHEPDDFRPDNPPSIPALLEYLKSELIRANYDTRHLYRIILNSRTWQHTSLAGPNDLARTEGKFAFYPMRRLEAEVLIDAINKVTGTRELYTSPIPEPFTFVPETRSAVSLPDGSITSPFLELFGRPARATGMENERSNRPLPAQWMHLLNSSHIQNKIQSSPLLAVLTTAPGKDFDGILTDLYLTILNRPPAEAERKKFQEYARRGLVRGRDLWNDVAWALINSDEFLFRH